GATPATFSLTNLPTINVSPSSLPNGTAGAAYRQTLTASGGAGGPYTFAVTAGTLPAGFMLSSSGVLSGTATLAATYSFTVTPTGWVASLAPTPTPSPSTRRRRRISRSPARPASPRAALSASRSRPWTPLATWPPATGGR